MWAGCPHAHPSAKAQVTAYRNGRDGLARNGPDNYPRPGYITWQQALKAWTAQQEKAKPVDPIIGDTSRGSLLPAP
ncbi:hypothetical protein [Naumannella halotolerans]|uniref:hypothetical protein n=1 Tax=Naumannella halotolerans TaxID=993414 RepID=UPI00105F5F41|nr:hypothetical protein [Naumannella halotolerans]